MSARKLASHHPESVHACAAQAIRRVVYRIGVIETARLLGMSDSQMRRRLDKARFAWPYEDVVALKKRERDEFATREIHQAEEASLYGTVQGESVAAVDAVTAEMGAHGQIVGLTARILDQGITEEDRADVEALIALVQRSYAVDRRALACLAAKLGPKPAGKRGRA